jgi:hypothetical protein
VVFNAERTKHISSSFDAALYLAVVAAPDQTEALTSYFDKHEIHLADVKAGDRVRIS